MDHHIDCIHNLFASYLLLLLLLPSPFLHLGGSPGLEPGLTRCVTMAAYNRRPNHRRTNYLVEVTAVPLSRGVGGRDMRDGSLLPLGEPDEYAGPGYLRNHPTVM